MVSEVVGCDVVQETQIEFLYFFRTVEQQLFLNVVVLFLDRADIGSLVADDYLSSLDFFELVKSVFERFQGHANFPFVLWLVCLAEEQEQFLHVDLAELWLFFLLNFPL